MSDELDLSAANTLRKEVFRLVVRGDRRPAVTRVYEHLRVIQEDPAAAPTDCKDGCAHCCSLPVMITVPEADLLAEAIEQGPRREELVRRLVGSHAEIAGLSAEEIALRGVPCPLLDGSSGRGSCAVYEARPLACRTYTSYDVSICQAHAENPTIERTSPARPLDYLTQLVTQSGLAGPTQKAFELRALLVELLTKEKRKKLQPATIDVTFRPERQ
jgi:Fe-S-cluster containining protein